MDYVYNTVGNPVRMDDWTCTNTHKYDLLSQLKKVTDTKVNVVEYTYDGNGNQASTTYPDGSVVTYDYDGMGRVAEMVYPMVGSRPTTTTPSVIWSRWRTPIPAKRT